jgi:hypothetical protein
VITRFGQYDGVVLDDEEGEFVLYEDYLKEKQEWQNKMRELEDRLEMAYQEAGGYC